MNDVKVRVKVPASTANLGPGFDSLGMALNLYLWLEVGLSNRTKINYLNEGMDHLPTDKSNLIYQIIQMIYQKAGKTCPELEITIYSEIPLARGLGSSASAIVGALAAGNALLKNYFSMNELFQFANEVEKHPDNVAACLFGGIVVACEDGEQAHCIRIEPHSDLEVLVAVPTFQLLTKEARQVLPQQVSMQDAVFNLSHVAMLVTAFTSGQLHAISYAMKDKLHQPYRASLIPGMSEILENADQHGALGVALSGAGPSIISFVHKESLQKNELEVFLRDKFTQKQIEVKTMWLLPDSTGVQIHQVTQPDDDFRLFIEGKDL